MAANFYKQFYTSEAVQGLEHLLNHVPRKVTTEMNETLTVPFTCEEVKKALFQMFPTKAPGPDGYPAYFFQKHWDVCGEDVTKAVLGTVSGKESVECIVDTILVLIPKVKSPTLLSQFRPINCRIFPNDQPPLRRQPFPPFRMDRGGVPSSAGISLPSTQASHLRLTGTVAPRFD